MTNIIGVIPARIASKRFPGKPLALLLGKPLIQWVVESARKCPKLNKIIVATDDKKIFSFVEKIGTEAIMTQAHHRSGTDRIIELMEKTDGEIYINIQGDEPIIHPTTISGVINLFTNKKVKIGTSATLFKNEKDFQDPNQVKVVFRKDQKVMYFSRAPIPYFTQSDFNMHRYKHLGIYGYRRKALQEIKKMPISKIEMTESLEQLRFLMNGMDIYIDISKHDSIGVDTPEDIERVKKLIIKNKKF